MGLHKQPRGGSQPPPSDSSPSSLTGLIQPVTEVSVLCLDQKVGHRGTELGCVCYAITPLHPKYGVALLGDFSDYRSCEHYAGELHIVAFDRGLASPSLLSRVTDFDPKLLSRLAQIILASVVVVVDLRQGLGPASIVDHKRICEGHSETLSVVVGSLTGHDSSRPEGQTGWTTVYR